MPIIDAPRYLVQASAAVKRELCENNAIVQHNGTCGGDVVIECFRSYWAGDSVLPRSPIGEYGVCVDPSEADPRHSSKPQTILKMQRKFENTGTPRKGRKDRNKTTSKNKKPYSKKQ